MSDVDHINKALDAMRQARIVTPAIQRQVVVEAINLLLEVATGNDLEVRCMYAAAQLQLAFDIPCDEVELTKEGT